MIISAVGQRNPRGFTISWFDLDCEDVNSESVVEYIVRYQQRGSNTVAMRNAASSPFTLLDPDLVTLTAYEVEVTVVNNVGAGRFSTPVEAFIFVG